MSEPRSLLTAHAASTPAGRPLETLAFVAGVAVLGALMAFDLCGFATLFRPETGVTRWGRWVRERWDSRDPVTFVGWSFFLVGAFSTPYFLLAALAPGTLAADVGSPLLDALLGAFGLWLVPALWRGPSRRPPLHDQAARLIRLRYSALSWLDEDPMLQHRARAFVPVLAAYWCGLIAIILDIILAQVNGAAAAVLAVGVDVFFLGAVLSAFFMVSAVAYSLPRFVVPPHLRNAPEPPLSGHD